MDYATEISTIDAQIAALKAQRETVLKDGEKIAREEHKAIEREFDWRVIWTSPRVMSVECRLNDATLERLNAWKEKWPNVLFFSGMNEPGKWHGMRFYLIGVTIISTGGGSVILNLKDSWHDREPQDLTQEQADAFRAGIVPVELQKPW